MLFQDATLLHLDPPGIGRGDFRVGEDGLFAAVGGRIEPHTGEPVRRLGGAVVTPGLVSGHHHLWRTLGRRRPGPAPDPLRFREARERLWRPLAEAHDAESLEASALAGAAEAALSGVTALLDHHTPGAVAPAAEDALEALRRGVEQIGLRGVFSLGASERGGGAGRDGALAETRRFVEKWRGPVFAGMVGIESLAEISDEGLALCARLAMETGAGIHLPLAEDASDLALSESRWGGAGALARLEAAGLLREGTLLAHPAHADFTLIQAARRAGCRFVHCPRGEMEAAAGCAPLAALRGACLLGADGMGGDLLEEARAAWWKSRDARSRLEREEILAALAGSARFASARLGLALGRLAAGAAADFAIWDYDPPEPLEPETAAAHWLGGLGARHAREVYVAGRPVVLEGRVIRVAPERLGAGAREAARRLWSRAGGIRGGAEKE